MDNVIQVVNGMREISRAIGRDEKLMVLDSLQSDYDWSSFSKLYFDPNVSFHIKKIDNWGTIRDLDIVQSDLTLMDVLLYCSTNNYSKLLEQLCISYILSVPKEVRDDIYEILTKSYRLGISNQAVAEFIGVGTCSSSGVQIFKPMLAKSFWDRIGYSKIRDRLEQKGFVITQKLDGVRAVWNGESLYSRTGKKFTGLEELENELRNSEFRKVSLDGELMAGANPLTKFAKTVSKVRRKDAQTNVFFHVFDLPSSLNEYSSRRAVLEEMFADAKGLEHVSLLPKWYEGHDISQISRVYERLRAQGAEGVMVNVLDGRYSGRRVDDLLKVKSMLEDEFEVIDWVEGEGRLRNKLGALVVQGHGVTCYVGTGFTDEDRDLSPDWWIGKIVTIQYFEKTDDGSLRFPVFKGVRIDYDSKSKE